MERRWMRDHRASAEAHPKVVIPDGARGAADRAVLANVVDSPVHDAMPTGIAGDSPGDVRQDVRRVVSVICPEKQIQSPVAWSSALFQAWKMPRSGSDTQYAMRGALRSMIARVPSDDAPSITISSTWPYVCSKTLSNARWIVLAPL